MTPQLASSPGVPFAGMSTQTQCTSRQNFRALILDIVPAACSRECYRPFLSCSSSFQVVLFPSIRNSIFP